MRNVYRSRLPGVRDTKSSKPLTLHLLAQALSNTVWALSKLEVESRDSALLDAVAAAILPALPDFNAQNIANTVRSFSFPRSLTGPTEGIHTELGAGSLRFASPCLA